MLYSNCFRTACKNGTYSLGSQIKCTECQPGFRCPLTSSGPIQCHPGTYSVINSVTCQTCRAGFQCSNPAGRHFPEPLLMQREREKGKDSCRTEQRSNRPLPSTTGDKGVRCTLFSEVIHNHHKDLNGNFVSLPSACSGSLRRGWNWDRICSEFCYLQRYHQTKSFD